MPEQDEPDPGGPPQDAPSQGEHSPREPRQQRVRSRSAKFVWLTVGSAAVLLLGGFGIAFADSGFGHSASKRRFSRTFTYAPPGCDMVKPATIKRYTASAKVTKDTSAGPGSSKNPPLKYALCTSDSLYEEGRSGLGHLYRHADWKSPDATPDNGLLAMMDVELTVSSVARKLYDPIRNSTISNHRHDYDVTDARQVSGLGDAAYIIYGKGRRRMYDFDGYAVLITYWGNAEMKVIYQGRHQSPGSEPKAVSQQPAEAAVLAIARDVYASLGCGLCLPRSVSLYPPE
ncbi:hypothetical protein [Actinoallomurus iriomotensis]|nr:hypothetical protein [Actinoallomurus iriomotensis]